MVALYSDGSSYVLFQFAGKQAELKYKRCCILENFGRTQINANTALTLLNINGPEEFDAAVFASLHQLIVSTFPREEMIKEMASRDLWNPVSKAVLKPRMQQTVNVVEPGTASQTGWGQPTWNNR